MDGPLVLTATIGNITNASVVDESLFPTEGKPEMVFPFGLISFTIPDVIQGGVADIQLTFPDSIPSSCEYWKYGATASAPNGEWYQIDVQSNDGDSILAISVTDGGLGDDDLQANGVIVDAGGPAVPTAVSTTGSGVGGACFVATTACGALKESLVSSLPQLRDNFLLKNTIGKSFVNIY